jgi:hypothetical protein
MLRPVLPLSLTPRDEENVDAGDAGFFGTFEDPTLLLLALILLGFELLCCLLRKRVRGETLKDGAPGKA